MSDDDVSMASTASPLDMPDMMSRPRLVGHGRVCGTTRWTDDREVPDEAEKAGEERLRVVTPTQRFRHGEGARGSSLAKNHELLCVFS